jgi:hypothetical protein
MEASRGQQKRTKLTVVTFFPKRTLSRVWAQRLIIAREEVEVLQKQPRASPWLFLPRCGQPILNKNVMCPTDSPTKTQPIPHRKPDIAMSRGKKAASSARPE